MLRSRELLVEFDREVWAAETEPRFVIAKGRYLDEEEWHDVTIKGNAKPGELVYGLPYRLFGKWKHDDRYKEDQFHFSSFVPARPRTERGVIKYLMTVNHIGPTRARKLWELFQGEAIDVLRDDPERVVQLFPGLTAENAKAASEDLKTRAGLEDATVELLDLFDGRGFPRSLVTKCLEKWGNKAPDVIRESPFKLRIFRGVGFALCDRLYIELCLDPAAIDRQAFAMRHAVESGDEGHVWVPFATASRIMASLVGGASPRPREALELAMANGDLVRRVDSSGMEWVAQTYLATAEAVIAERVADLLGEPPHWPDLNEVQGLYPHQREQLARAIAGRVGILTGSPGTGKTVTIAALVSAIQRTLGGEVALCAPTGKAARRMTESLRSGGLQACTIHRLLQVEYSVDDGGFRFVHGPDNPLPCSWLILDECSMGDVTIMAHLLAAVPRGCHVLFVGDTQQLPPVGPGAPLRDMIAAGVPTGELREIQRNSGRIVKACAEIRDYGVFEGSSQLDMDNGENLLVCQVSRPEDQVSKLDALIGAVLRGGNYDCIHDLQVLCAVNANSELAREKLNEHLQMLLNPQGATAEGNRFRVGDKVICLKNSWLTAMEAPSDVPRNAAEQIWIANGEMGEVEDVTAKFSLVRLTQPNRLVRVPNRRPDAESGQTEGAASDWDLGYAISAHKSQGSGWPIVVVMIDPSFSARRVMSKNWLYTAISRAEEMCILIGRKQVAIDCCKVDAISPRKTFLAEQLRRMLPDLTPPQELIVSCHDERNPLSAK